MIPSPIFLVGCDRSGTTLLRLLLDRSPSLHIPPESGFLTELAERSEDYADFTSSRARWFFIRDLQASNATSRTRAFDIFDLTVEEAERVLAEAAPTDYAGAAAALFTAAAANRGKPRWGDKTPRYVLYVDQLASLFADSLFVHIIRDPRAVAASIRAAGWGGSFAGAAAFWMERVGAGRRAGARLGPERYREVRYENLVRDPERELRSLCEWLGVDYAPEMLDFHRGSGQEIPAAHLDLFPLITSPVDASRAEAWKEQLDRSAIADIEAIAGEAMTELGYEPLGLRQRIWVRGLRSLVRLTRPVARRVARFTGELAPASPEA